MTRFRIFVSLLPLCFVAGAAIVQTAKQPKVQPGPNEPDWKVILEKKYRLSMFADLLNPVETTTEATPGLFVKAGPGPVQYQVEIALGLDTITRGGWYRGGNTPKKPEKKELWSYRYKNTTHDIETGEHLPPPLLEGSTSTFEPGEEPFGVWVSNDGLKDGGVFSEPKVVLALNARLAKQPYKAMIYPVKDRKSGAIVPNSYLIGWEYSTNDDFQDVVCRIDNVRLVVPIKPLP